MKYNFCPKCGRELIEKFSWDEGGVPYCTNCDIMYFDTPKPCIIVAVVKEEKILLLKQSYIYENSKVLVSGYVTNGEVVEETVYREVKEETGIEIENINYLGSYFVDTKEILMLTFMANYKSGDIIKSDEVENVEWVDIEDALCDMSEDEIGKDIVKKVLKEINYTGNNAYRCEIDGICREKE